MGSEQRIVFGYHGCEKKVAEAILAGDTALRPSSNRYDWLGLGIYFWEEGRARAWKWADDEVKRGRLKEAAVVGAELALGECFDLVDVDAMEALKLAFEQYRAMRAEHNLPLPENRARNPADRDRIFRDRDCAVLNYLANSFAKEGILLDTVRGVFEEGEPVYEGSMIRERSHVQIAVRNISCILRTFPAER